MTRALVCLACALCVAATIPTAAGDAAPFIPVTADELPEEFRGSPAVILQDTRDWDVVPHRRATYSVSRRLLVLERRGFRFADQHVSYDKRQGSIESFYARTILPDGEVISVPDDLRNELVTFKDEDQEWRSLHFTFPKMRVGAVLEWGYALTEKDPSVMKWWEVQDEIPVIEARFSLHARQPSTFSPPGGKAYSRVDYGDHCKVVREELGPRNSEFEMLCQNVPARVEEPRSPPEQDTNIDFIISWGRAGFGVTDWTGKADLWRRSVEFYITKRSAVAALAAELADAGMSDEEKLNAIYDFIKRKMEVRTVYYAPRQRGRQSTFESVDEMLASGGGLPPEITMLTLALLREAGVAASPVLAHDRSAGRFAPLFPDLSQANHLMLRVNIEGQQAIIDPSCLHCEAGTPDWRYCDSRPNALMIDGFATPFGIGTVPAKHNGEVREEHATLSTDGSATVHGTVTWTGHSEVDRRREWDGLAETTRQDRFRATLVGDVSELTVDVSDPEEFFEHLSASYQLHRHDLPPLPDGTLLVRPPDVFTPRLPLPLQEERIHPVWLPYSYAMRSKIVFKLPKGYRIEDLPDKGESVIGAGMMFKHKWSEGPGREEVTWEGLLTVGRTNIQVEHYGDAREFAQRLRQVLRGGVVARTTGGVR
jgi:hypothetical protein